MSKSIVDFSRSVYKDDRRFSVFPYSCSIDSPGDVACISPSLDIHRDFAAPDVTESKRTKITRKVTPDKVYTLEQKREWKRRLDKLIDKRESAARSIVLDYVNRTEESVSADLSPMAAAVVEKEEREVRLAQFRSFLKCLNKNNDASVDLVLYDDNNVILSGVWRCGSLWQCPRCASAGLYKYSRRIADVLSAIQKENEIRKESGDPCFSVLFCTLTVPHSPGDKLEEQMSLFSRVWSLVNNARPIRDIKEKYGCIGSIRAFDHTVTFRDGLRDWHTHFHNLLVFDPLEGCGVELSDDDVETGKTGIEKVLFDVWADRVRKYSGRSCVDEAFNVEKVDLTNEGRSDRAVADYTAKICCLSGYMTKSQKERRGEVLVPAGPPFRSLSPFELLDAYSDFGTAFYDYAAAWVDYCVATKGFHRVQFSKGLEKKLGIERQDKKEKSASPVCRHCLPAPVAAVALRDSGVLNDLKDAVRADDVCVYWDILEPLGLSWAADEVADKKMLEPRPLTDTERALARFRISRSLDLSELLEGWSGGVVVEETLPAKKEMRIVSKKR